MSTLSFTVPTNQFSRLRACMVCSIVRTETKFRNEGCPNCEEYLEVSTRDSGVEVCTSPAFEGLITLNDPKTSWVAKWQRLDSYIPGTYAVKVSGEVGLLLQRAS